ncbi:biotin--[acetyl-CoA-carboxylase] ligase [soil metagenome]|nr:biotin--[acetyl-CoA-carboxylase] ligase [Trueperaceae bacterium]
MSARAALEWRVAHLESVVSTQDLARDRVEGGAGEGLVIVAREQRGGRGRRRRDWSSPPGGLWLTAVLAVERLSALAATAWPAATTVAVARRLRALGCRVDVKWPNDLVVGGATSGKLAGVLVERRGAHALVGVGLNVTNDVPEGAVALRALLPNVGSRELWQSARRAVLDGLQEAVTTSPDQLVARWDQLDAYRGAEVTIVDGESTTVGTVLGLASDGRLRLLVGTDELAVGRGKVHVRPA